MRPDNGMRRNDVLVPLSVLVATVGLFAGLLQIQEQSLKLERRITTVEVKLDTVLDKLIPAQGK